MLVAINIIFVPRYGYMACAWAGFAGYGTAMLISYLVGQKHYPINYPVGEIMAYVVLAAILYLCMDWSNSHLPTLGALALNTALIALFGAYLVKKDFPLGSLPVVGRYFRK